VVFVCNFSKKRDLGDSVRVVTFGHPLALSSADVGAGIETAGRGKTRRCNKSPRKMMSLAGHRDTLFSSAKWFGILYALASCVNMREELLAIQATLPAMRSTLASSVMSAFRFFVA
jgi:hypothetical protein